MEKKKKAHNGISFEEALKELEEIAQKLEEGEMGLDESIASFERGIQLSRFCHKKLEEAEKKIEILQKGDDKKIHKKNVTIDHETGEIDDDVQGNLL